LFSRRATLGQHGPHRVAPPNANRPHEVHQSHLTWCSAASWKVNRRIRMTDRHEAVNFHVVLAPRHPGPARMSVDTRKSLSADITHSIAYSNQTGSPGDTAPERSVQDTLSCGHTADPRCPSASRSGAQGRLRPEHRKQRGSMVLRIAVRDHCPPDGNLAVRRQGLLVRRREPPVRLRGFCDVR